MNTIILDRPDILLVCESGSLDTRRILDLASSHPIMMGLFIIIVRLYTSVIEIYETPPINISGKICFKSNQINAETEEDLLNALRRK